MKNEFTVEESNLISIYTRMIHAFNMIGQGIIRIKMKGLDLVCIQNNWNSVSRQSQMHHIGRREVFLICGILAILRLSVRFLRRLA